MVAVGNRHDGESSDDRGILRMIDTKNLSGAGMNLEWRERRSLQVSTNQLEHGQRYSNFSRYGFRSHAKAQRRKDGGRGLPESFAALRLCVRHSRLLQNRNRHI